MLHHVRAWSAVLVSGQPRLAVWHQSVVTTSRSHSPDITRCASVDSLIVPQLLHILAHLGQRIFCFEEFVRTPHNRGESKKQDVKFESEESANLKRASVEKTSDHEFHKRPVGVSCEVERHVDHLRREASR